MTYAIGFDRGTGKDESCAVLGKLRADGSIEILEVLRGESANRVAGQRLGEVTMTDEPMSEAEYIRRSTFSRGTLAAGASNIVAVVLCACPVSEMLYRHRVGLPFVSGWLVVDALMVGAGLLFLAMGYWTLLHFNLRLRDDYMRGRR